MSIRRNISIFASLSFLLESTYAGPLANRLICQPLLAQLDEVFECNCDASFSFTSLFEGDLACTTNEPICIPATGTGLDELLCGTPTVSGNYAFRGEPSFTNACFEFDDAFNVIDSLCLEGQHVQGNPTILESCTVQYGDEVCDSCTVCESGRDITFDCSNVNVNPFPFPFIPGIKVEQCIGAGLVLDIVGAPNSVAPFIPFAE